MHMPMAGLDSPTARRAATCEKFIQKVRPYPPPYERYPLPNVPRVNTLFVPEPRGSYFEGLKDLMTLSLLNINVLCNAFRWPIYPAIQSQLQLGEINRHLSIYNPPPPQPHPRTAASLPLLYSLEFYWLKSAG